MWDSGLVRGCDESSCQVDRASSPASQEGYMKSLEKYPNPKPVNMTEFGK